MMFLRCTAILSSDSRSNFCRLASESCRGSKGSGGLFAALVAVATAPASTKEEEEVVVVVRTFKLGTSELERDLLWS